MSVNPICFRCVHFRQYRPLYFVTPGECSWEPKEAIPPWLQFWLDGKDSMYGPKREVVTNQFRAIMECEAFKGKTDEMPSV